VSFAYLVYASAWFKLHHPAAFCVALVNSQPMGFYSPQSLVQDARRHGVEVRGPDVQRSADVATLEPGPGGADPPAVRLGLASVRGVGAELAERIADGAPYRDLEDLARRTGADRTQLESLATAGAFSSLSDRDGRPLDRRRALWAAGAAAQARPDRLPGTSGVVDAPRLPGMDPWEEAVADLWSTGVTPDGHPFGLLRDDLDRRGVTPAAELRSGGDGSTVRVAGVVTHRQRPATARGITFLSLEDDTGLVNVVVSVGCWERHRRVVRDAPALCIRGRLERSVDGVVNVVAHRIEALPVTVPARARDFR
jgi:error-prone DNA polymerase